MMDQSFVEKFTKAILDVMFFAGFAVIPTLPWTLGLTGKYYDERYLAYLWPMVALFALAGLCAERILWELRKMMATVLGQDCFVEGNVESLRRMGIVSFLIAALYFGKMFLVPTPATIVVVLTFFIAGLFSLVLSRVFAEAVRCKKENDLTI